MFKLLGRDSIIFSEQFNEVILYKLFETQWGMGYPYHFYIGYCNEEYECKLNEENQDWGWFDINDLPKPLFPTLFSSLVRIL